MKKALFLVAVAALLPAAARAAGDGAREVPRNPIAWTMAGSLREGDLVRIDDHFVLVGPPGEDPVPAEVWRGKPDPEDPEAMAAPPPGTRHLVATSEPEVYDGTLGFGVTDFSCLPKLADLETLALGSGNREFDLSLVVPCTKLRTLDLTDQRLLHPELLAKMTALQRIVLVKSAVHDLSPIAELPAVRVVDASFSRVAVLPESRVPSLVELHLIGAEVPDEAVAAFAAKNPQCRVWHRFGPSFRRELEGADRLRVIVDPDAKTDPGKELFAVEGADAVADLLGRIGAFEKGSPDSFSMGASPIRIEIRRGDELLASLGMPEPNLISGVARLPSHLTLTAASAERVAEWFAEHGVAGPRERLKRYLREHGAERRRWEAYDPLLPETLYRWATYGMTADEALAEFRTAFPDPVVRAGMYVLVLGASEARWDRDLGIDELVAGSLLPAVNQRTLDRVAVLAMKDVRGGRGLGRWLFGEGRLDRLNDRTLAKVFPDVARYALESPYRVNRQRTMAGLGEIGGRVAVALLTEVLDQSIVHRRLPDPDEDASAGEVPWRQSERFEPERDLGDAAFAALVLAKLGEEKCLPRLRELAAAADGPDRAAFEEAIGLLAD